MVITPIFLDGHACGKSGTIFSYLCERTLSIQLKWAN